MQDWDDGYINQDSSGRRVFYIRKQFAGKRHHFSLQTGDLEIALREYRRGRATTQRLYARLAAPPKVPTLR